MSFMAEMSCGETERLTEAGLYLRGGTRPTTYAPELPVADQSATKVKCCEGSEFHRWLEATSGSNGANANRVRANCCGRISARVGRAGPNSARPWPCRTGSGKGAHPQEDDQAFSGCTAKSGTEAGGKQSYRQAFRFTPEARLGSPAVFVPFPLGSAPAAYSIQHGALAS
jgi:hypothetical protein